MDKQKNVPITKDTLIGDLVAAYPHLAQVLSEDYGLHCVSCWAAAFDTLESGAKLHGLSDEEIAEMVKWLQTLSKQ